MKYGIPTYTYLYGYTKEQVIELKDLKHDEALHKKIRDAKALASRLLDKDYMEIDDYRVNRVLEAVEHNEELLDELKVK